MIGYIYAITNKLDGKQYVGKTVRQLSARMAQHIQDSVRIKGRLYNAMRKYGPENFQIAPIETVLEGNLDEREKFWIKKLDTRKSGYNMTDGGDGAPPGNSYNKGRKHTAEARKNMSLAHIGKPGHMKGRKWSEESRKKMLGNKNARGRIHEVQEIC